MSSRSPWRVDFEDLVLLGVLRWGEVQGTADGATVREAIDRQSLFLQLGRDAGAILPGDHRLVVHEQVINYRIGGEVVLIVRIGRRTQDAMDVLRLGTS